MLLDLKCVSVAYFNEMCKLYEKRQSLVQTSTGTLPEELLHRWDNKFNTDFREHKSV